MNKRYLSAMVWGVAIISGEAHAEALDEAVCRGHYPVMLMTDAECRAHVGHLETLRARGESRALRHAQQEHARLLDERAEACLCVFPQPGASYLQHTAALDIDC